jgi:hypothetical protein
MTSRPSNSVRIIARRNDHILTPTGELHVCPQERGHCVRPKTQAGWGFNAV